MVYDEDDYLSLAGIQHYTFCTRRWALIFIECIWDDNSLTVSGTLMHENVHDPFFTEKRGDTIISRNMPIFSRNMGITGRSDVVEFHRDAKGISIYGREGCWAFYPVEYKHGHAQKNDSDRLQLCAEAMCLEEMFASRQINEAYLYYGETKRRETVILDDALRNRVVSSYKEMHDLYKRGYTPRVKPKKACVSCSLYDICIPKLPAIDKSVKTYISSKIDEDVL